MSFAVVFVATVAVFLVLDAVMLTLVLRPLFERHIADMLRPEIRLGAAAAFYVAYGAGLVWLAGWPAFRAGAPMQAALPAAVIGFMAYGTYEFTNYAVLRGWHWSMVATDVTWGMVLSAVSAVAGVAIARWITGG
jgi:uncharacterized membrane protein